MGKRSRTVSSRVERVERMLPHVEMAAQPEEEEEGVHFGDDAGHNEPAEPIARRTKRS